MFTESFGRREYSVESTNDNDPELQNDVAVRRGAAVAMAVVTCAMAADQVRTESGIEGTTRTDSKIHIYKGIPFAAPPIGPSRCSRDSPRLPGRGFVIASGTGRAACREESIRTLLSSRPRPE